MCLSQILWAFLSTQNSLFRSSQGTWVQLPAPPCFLRTVYNPVPQYWCPLLVCVSRHQTCRCSTDLKSKHSYIELCFKKTNQHPGDLTYLSLGIVTERISLSCWGLHCTQGHLVLLELRILMISTLCFLCPYATPKYSGRKFEACLGYAACLLLLSLCVHTLLPVFRSKHWIHFILLILGNDI